MPADTPMPMYRCHKKVWALKIKAILIPSDTSGTPEIVPELPGLDPIRVDNAYISKHTPHVGGYYVVYEDGYKSFSPASAFEGGYTLARGNTFGDAIEAMRAGKKCARVGWNGRGMWISLQVPDEHSKMGLPYFYMSTVDGRLVPWLASQTDMLAYDWLILD